MRPVQKLTSVYTIAAQKATPEELCSSGVFLVKRHIFYDGKEECARETQEGIHRRTNRFPSASHLATGVLPRKRLALSAPGGVLPLSLRYFNHSFQNLAF